MTGSGSPGSASLDAVTKSYAKTTALKNASLTLRPGCTGLIGVNGAGKSTLLNILAGALPPTSGGVTIGGDDPYAARTRKRALSRVALMPQSARLPGRMTSLELVTYLTWMRGVGRREAGARALESLERVRLADEASTPIRALSGGMVRRVLLAQALAAKSEVLLLDEPSTGLDPEQRRTMIDVLTDLGGTILLSSHVMEDVEDLVDRVVVLHGGRVVLDGGLPDLLEHAESTSGPRALESGFIRLIAGRGPG